MPKFFVKDSQIKGKNVIINGEDVNHIVNVLRMSKGDTLNVCNMDNSENYLVEIKEVGKLDIVCEIKEKLKIKAESNVLVDIYQGLPKGDKMELIIQKSVELGVRSIIPVEMKRCVVKLDGKDRVKKIARWQKIAEVAAKQSGRDIIPELGDVKNVKEISGEFSKYDLVLLCYENEKNVFLKDVLKQFDGDNNIKIAVIVGPEGGIDISEVEYMKENGAKVVSLGNRILRTETVSLSILSVIMYEFERNEF